MLDSSRLFDKAVIEGLREIDGYERAELVGRIWPDTTLNRSVFDEFSYIAIVEHIVNELELVRHHGRVFAAQTFQQFFAIVDLLKQNTSLEYANILQQLQANYRDIPPENIRRSVELAVRVWLTINVHSSSIFKGPIFTPDVPIEWHLNSSLEQSIQSSFGRRRQLHPSNQTRWDLAVTVAYLVNTCGMKVCWSEDMTNHLQFEANTLELTIYRHKACLISHLDGPDKCPISSDILEEMLDTMDLVLPPWENATKQFLQKEGQQSLYTLGCRKPTREVDLSRYKYFGERLQYLIESFDKTPRTWKQLALDQRNKLEWSAFWITVMVGVLTVVSIPCSLIQATYSVKAYNLAVAQGVA